MLIFFTLLISICSNEAFNIDTVQQWNDSKLVCGYPVHTLQPFEWLEEEFLAITRNETIIVDRNLNKTRKIIATYQDFLCCLKNVWISVKNSFQKQKCLKFFMKCIRSTRQQPCYVPWTYYLNLAVRDLRVATMMVVTSALFFVTAVILVEKCKNREYDSFTYSTP